MRCTAEPNIAAEADKMNAAVPSDVADVAPRAPMLEVHQTSVIVGTGTANAMHLDVEAGTPAGDPRRGVGEGDVLEGELVVGEHCNGRENATLVGIHRIMGEPHVPQLQSLDRIVQAANPSPYRVVKLGDAIQLNDACCSVDDLLDLDRLPYRTSDVGRRRMIVNLL